MVGPVSSSATGSSQPQLVAHAGHQARGQDGLPAQVEEVVVHAHPLHPQHLAPERREPLLQLAARRHVGRGGRRLAVVVGERAPVQLAARGPRQRVDPAEGGGHHVLREPLAQEGAQLGRLGASPPRRGAPGRRPGAARRPPRRGRPRRPRPRRVGGERLLHLFQLDAVAAHLHLRVGAPQVLQPPSSSQRPRSSVRYIRAPGRPNGSGTKRSAVSAGRPA
jgi:hypothetical protein